MKNNIGYLIRNRSEQVGISKSELARRISCSPQNIYDVFARESIDTTMLLRISVVLQYNFFTSFFQFAEKGIRESRKKTENFENDLSLLDQTKLTEKDELKYLKMRISYLEELNSLLKEKLKSL